MIVADLLRRIRAKADAPRAAAPARPSGWAAQTFPVIALASCAYCGTERVVRLHREPRRHDFCSHRCALKARTRVIHGMRIRWEQAKKAERLEAAAKRKAIARPSASNVRRVAA